MFIMQQLQERCDCTRCVHVGIVNYVRYALKHSDNNSKKFTRKKYCLHGTILYMLRVVSV